MKTQSQLLLLAALALTASPLRAQIVADGTTTTLNNVTNTITGDVTVGTNGSFTLLILSDNALLTNSANGGVAQYKRRLHEHQRRVEGNFWRLGSVG